MDHRMSLRVATERPVTVHPRIGRAVTGKLRDVSFDGAFLAIEDGHPESLLTRHVRVRAAERSAPGDLPVEIPALVIRASADGVGLVFGGYDEVANEYLAQIYNERLSSAPATVSV